MSATSTENQRFGWKEAIIGGVITLVVTTMAGISVWLFTRDPNKTEKIVYRIESPAIFSGQGKSIALQLVSVRNDGLSKGEGVVIDVTIPANAKIIDSSLVFTSGPSVQSTVKSSSTGVSYFIPSLLPSDKATLSLLLTGTGAKYLSFAVRSQQRIAVREQQDTYSTSPSTGKTLAILIPTALAQFIIIQFFNFRRQQRRMRNFQVAMENSGAYTPGRNNAAFVMMHNDLLDSAEEVFWQEIKGGRAELMTIAHYGALLALKDDPTADRYIVASKWPGGDLHTKANIDVDEFIVAAHRGDVSAARETAKRAIAFSKGVASYFRSSALLKRLIAKHGLEEFITQELDR